MFEIPFTSKRRGVETKLVMGKICAKKDPIMARTLKQAIAWKQAVAGDMGITELAKKEGLHARHIRNRIQMAFLSPRIMQAIADGTHPPDLSTETFVRTDIPLCWAEQEELFGFNFSS